MSSNKSPAERYGKRKEAENEAKFRLAEKLRDALAEINKLLEQTK